MGMSKDLVIFAIGIGMKDLKSISFFCDMPKEKVQEVIESCEKQNLVRVEGDGFSLTSFGLLQASFDLIEGDDIDISCQSVTGKPYFAYRNYLEKDVIFLPFLAFDERENLVGDRGYRIYTTTIKREKVGGFEVLQAIENCMSWYGFEGRGGFWILKAHNHSFCGFGVSALYKAIDEVGNSNAEAKIAYSANPYIVLVTANLTRNSIEELTLKFNLSNCGETPYADTLKFLEDRLRIFLEFIGEKEIPRGKEVVMESLTFRDSDYTIAGHGFVPKAIGKYLFNSKIGARVEIPNLPLIIVVSSDEFDELTHLGKVSPWFVTCIGGFVPKDFSENRRFKLGNLESYILGDEVIVCLRFIRI